MGERPFSLLCLIRSFFESIGSHPEPGPVGTCVSINKSNILGGFLSPFSLRAIETYGFGLVSPWWKVKVLLLRASRQVDTSLYVGVMPLPK